MGKGRGAKRWRLIAFAICIVVVGSGVTASAAFRDAAERGRSPDQLSAGLLTQMIDGAHPQLEARNTPFAEAMDEYTLEHCATTITEEGGEGCPVRVSGEVTIWVFSNPTMCQIDMEGRISETGTLMVDSWAFTPSPCSLFVPCTESGQRHPEATITGGASPSWTTEWTYCLLLPNVNPPTPIECHVAGTLSEVATHTYQYGLSAAQHCIQGISMGGALTITADQEHPAVEIR